MRFRQYVCCSKSKECVYEGFWVNKNDPCIYCGKTYEETRTVWNKLYLMIPHKVRQIFTWRNYTRAWRFFWQRRFRGFDDSELWSLDYTCARLMAPRLRAFIDQFGGRSVPCSFTSIQEWKPITDEQCQAWVATLEKIQRAFQLIVDCDSATYMLSNEERQEIEKGLDLFREYFFALWD